MMRWPYSIVVYQNNIFTTSTRILIRNFTSKINEFSFLCEGTNNQINNRIRILNAMPQIACKKIRGKQTTNWRFPILFCTDHKKGWWPRNSAFACFPTGWAATKREHMWFLFVCSGRTNCCTLGEQTAAVFPDGRTPLFPPCRWSELFQEYRAQGTIHPSSPIFKNSNELERLNI